MKLTLSRSLRRWGFISVFIALLSSVGLSGVSAVPASQSATCRVSVRVAILEDTAPTMDLDQHASENSKSPTIDLTRATSGNGAVEGSTEVSFAATGDVDITADQTLSYRLSEAGGGSLVTEYALAFDGDGRSATGAAAVRHTPSERFLKRPLRVRHVSRDNNVRLKLSVRGENPSGEAVEADAYTGTVTLTVCWVESSDARAGSLQRQARL